MRNIQTDLPREHNYCSCLANNLFWYTHRVHGQSVNAVAPSLPHYEGVIVAHRQRTTCTTSSTTMGLRHDEVVLLAAVVFLTTLVCDGATKYGRCSSLCTSINDRIELY